MITPILAVLFGIVGIRATRNPTVSGRGLAVSGLVLGLVWLLLFAAGGAGFAVLWHNSEAPVAAARQFTTDLAAGQIDAALARTSGIKAEDLDAAHKAIAPWGTLTDLSLGSRNADWSSGTTQWTLKGTATFSTGGAKPANFVLVPTGKTGDYKVIGFEIN